MPTIIPLYRPLLWPRVVIGIVAFCALSLAAGVTFAREPSVETNGPVIADVTKT